MREIPGCDHILNLADIQPKEGKITAMICDFAQAFGLPKWQVKADVLARFYSLAFLLEEIKTGNESVIIYETPFIFATSEKEFSDAEWQLWKSGLIASGDRLYGLRWVSETDCGFAPLAQFGPF